MAQNHNSPSVRWSVRPSLLHQMVSTVSAPAASRTTEALPHLAISMGDPAGIGPEVILKALAKPALSQSCDITLVGCGRWLQSTYRRLLDQGQAVADPSQFKLVDIPLKEEIILGQPNRGTGAASFDALNGAIDLALSGKAEAVVTGPIAKSAWKSAGHHYPGQTELLASRADCDDFAMAFLGESPHTGWELRSLLATTHIPLHQVPTALTPQLMTRKLELLLRFLQERCGLTQPRIGIAGLNPHSGELGQLGTEEQDWLIPWLEEMRQRHPQAKLVGPVPPDTLWVTSGQAWYGLDEKGQLAAPRAKAPLARTYDAYLALYHDQGLIPVKLLAFDRAVNTTIGLPFVRTSPDHGTAFDIADQGVARSESMESAIAWAIRLIRSTAYIH